ncbi:MarR family winged helix-turn-helix transcriptional regulator [Rhodococcus sp. NPDC058521]|uniref:MarR family winged helix-turn-helix transcriptional regulator n=1 Tax=Rhodococcus sp. NPDC058521 TaxID=3346536 RepID=UPI00365C11A0
MSASSSDDLFGVLDEFFTRLMSASEPQSMDVLVGLDLSFSQVRMLFVLSWTDYLPINELAERLGLSVGTAGRNVDQLVTQGLVFREECESDRRIKRVSLSEAGRTVATTHLECKRDQLRQFATRVPELDRRRLIDALDPILSGESLPTSTQEISR